jgi:hypothetical protein
MHSEEEEKMESRLLQGMTYKDTFTENAMPTHSTSSDPCVDWFATVGSARNWSEDEIIAVFSKALYTDPLIAMRILFWARDAREGAGERRVFRVCLKFLEEEKILRKYLQKNLHLVPEYGRWDDLFHLETYDILELIAFGLDCSDGLLAKWLPRKGAFANRVRNHLRLTPKEYRKMLVKLSNTVEQLMCSKDWEAIKYEQVPSVAMNKYRKAFARNDNERFSKYIQDVLSGDAEIKAGVLFPYQLYQAYRRRENKSAVEAQWQSLPNFMEGNTRRVMPMCDTSGSMRCGYGGGSLAPMDISVSLGIYISERNDGLFKDAFMTFSEVPRIQYLKGSFYSRCAQLDKAHWSMNTNLEAAFDLLLGSAKRLEVAPDEMPNTLLIISDMQFDSCIRSPQAAASEMIKGQYEAAGYEFPNVVFWNVNARVGKMPVKFNEAGVALVSGCSPSILKSVLDGSILDPRSVMLKTVNSERYQAVTI